MARTLAKQFMKEFEEECSPFQFALSTRAGADCVGHVVRASTETDHGLTILSVDGIGAYHVSRASMLTRWSKSPRPPSCCPSSDCRTQDLHRMHGLTRRENVPENIEDISPEAWQPAGVKVLGTPTSSDQHVADKMSERIAKERELWDAIATVLDLQCAASPAECKSESKPCHAHVAAVSFQGVLRGPRRRHLEYCEAVDGNFTRDRH